MEARVARAADREWIRALVADHFASPRVVSRGRPHHVDDLAGLVAWLDDERVGVLLWRDEEPDGPVDSGREVVVISASRPGTGAGSTLLDAAAERAAAAGHRRLWLVTTNDNERAQAVYERRGWVRVAVHVGAVAESRKLKPEIPETNADGVPIRDEVEYAFDLTAHPRAVELREATVDDARGIATCNIASWRVTYRGHFPDSVLDSLDVEDSAPRWAQTLETGERRTLVADASGAVIGYGCIVPARDADDDPETVAEVPALYLDPKWWRLGLGTRLLDRLVAVARATGHSELTLWVLAANERAQIFYRSRGMAPDGASRSDSRLIGEPIDELRYRVGL